MKLEDFLEVFNKESKEELILLKKRNKELAKRVKMVEKEKEGLSEKLNSFQNRKLTRLVMDYYSIIEKYPFFRLFAKIIYMILLPLYGIVGLLARRNVSFEEKEGIEKILSIINESESKNIIFFISPVPWDIPLFQRPQHIASFMSKEGVLYFFIVQWQKNRKIRKIRKNCYEISVMDMELDFIKEVVLATKKKKQIFVKTYSTELENHLDLLKEIRQIDAKIIYEYVDEINADISGKEIPKHVIEKFENIVRDEENCYIVATASKLYEDVSFYRKKNFALITNGVDYDHFNKKFKKNDLPFQMLRIVQKGRPLIGYYGALASWMDYELLKYMAKERPDYDFLLIGVDYDGSILASGVEEYKNIFILPPVDYKDLPRYAYFLDICMIPFKINEITESTSPIKLFEYMALQKPIVTTAMPECKKYKSVMVAETYGEFVKNLDKAIDLKKDSKYLKLLDMEAKANTWESKAKEMVNLIKQD